MDSIIIQNYQPNNHEDVKRIFSLGMKEQILKGIKIGWKSPNVVGYLTFLFIFNCLKIITKNFAYIMSFCKLSFGIFFRNFVLLLLFVAFSFLAFKVYFK